jgi:3-dehydroquinate synthase
VSKRLEEITVGLGQRSYPILVEPGLLASVGRLVAERLRPTTVAVITDSHVAPLYGSRVLASIENAGFGCRLITVPAGERSKSLARLQKLYQEMFDLRMDRRSGVVALGGGVVGDLAGFAAATFMRGIPFVQVPTTLLADVDSSVGGKVAVNHPVGKNMIGAFYQPLMVIIDPETLVTLPRAELRSGLAEVVKCGVILDSRFFRFLETRCREILGLEAEDISHCMRRCCELKAYVVEKDERDTGLRAILNYGHTIAHALEALASFRGLRHGEAVAIGMVGTSYIAEEMGMVSSRVTERQRKLLEVFGLPTMLKNADGGAILKLLYRDKKTVGGRLRFILPLRIGKVEISDNVGEKVILRALGRLAGGSS